MLHMHFGTGRLGLGLAAPFLSTPTSELYFLNRAVPSARATGTTALDSKRRNDLLAQHPRKEYVIATPGEDQTPREVVQYKKFVAYGEDDVGDAVRQILEQTEAKKDGVVFSASLITLDHYAPVVEALNAVCEEKSRDGSSIGEVYLIACENTVSAEEVLDHSELGQRLSESTRCHLRCVHALVDRVCVELEEWDVDGAPTVVVRAEEYGSLKLEISSGLEDLPKVLEGSRAEFSHHLHVEKEIKTWLLNGSHWLIALTAFKESDGDTSVRLNDFINQTEDHRLYAGEVIKEMRDGVEALLRSDPQYEGFVREVDVSTYLDGAASSILARFQANDDTLARILARFKTPTSKEVTTVQSFADRFLHKIERPMLAYQEATGAAPKSISQGIFNLFRLQASGTYIDRDEEPERKIA